MTSETTAKKNIQKLQRTIVEALEDVKGQDIVVFNTGELSPLFERVIIASGNSNRQTKALAASVRDAVREAGFDKPRIEGEENGEWIIIDCGQAVVHVMQPVIRQYYRLEEIWGTKPVRLKTAAEKAAEARAKPPLKTASRATAKAEVAAVPARKVARKTAAAAPAPAARKSAAAKTGTSSRTATAKKAPAAKTAPTKRKAPLPKVVVNAPKPARKAAAKVPVKAPAAKKTTKTRKA